MKLRRLNSGAHLQLKLRVRHYSPVCVMYSKSVTISEAEMTLIIIRLNDPLGKSMLLFPVILGIDHFHQRT